MEYQFKGKPGPWTYRREAGRFSIEQVGGRFFIAETIGGLSGTQEQAHATLIAAAPDLLDACIAALKVIKGSTSIESIAATKCLEAIHKALNIDEDAG